MDVRLHPRPSDPYRWNILPTKAHLFRKNLSKLSTGIYSQIISGIGSFLEAVRPSDVDCTNPVEAPVYDDAVRDQSVRIWFVSEIEKVLILNKV